MQAVILQYPMNNRHTLLTGETEERHILEMDTEQAGEKRALRRIQIMTMRRLAIREHTVQQVEISALADILDIREYAEVTQKAQQEYDRGRFQKRRL